MTSKRFELVGGGRISPLDAACRWTERGYLVVPVPFREKGPKIAAWQKLRLKLEDLKNHFGSAPQNLGVLLGEPYGNADVDVDCAEALKLWPTFALDTRLVFGRLSKPRSHRFYRVDPPGPGVAFVDPVDNATMIEFRCLSKEGKVGFQTIVPPSTHKDTGELLRFEQGLDGDLANVELDLLSRAVAKTAAAAVLARHYPAKGRHKCELALAGVLARAKWRLEDAKDFVVALYCAVSTHDPNAVQRVARSVEDTFRKHAEGAEVTGIPRLTELIDERAVNAALRWLCLEQTGTTRSDWRASLIRNDRGKIFACVENSLIALRQATEWNCLLHFNESTLQTIAKAAPPWESRPTPFVWTDVDDVEAAAWLQRQGIMVRTDIASQAIQTVARDRAFHPIREFLNGLVWDKIQRIDDWMTLYLGVDPSDYIRAVGAKFLIGAVARIFQPGCKNDTCPVLEGAQGTLKSTALKTLGHPWFTDEIADLGSKDAAMQVRGVWIVEIAELDAMQKSEVSKVKAFISRSTDRYRPPYGRHVIEVARESVFAGTVNHDRYLKDETGGRRFWPVKCGFIDIASLKRDRDQLWAEAVARYRSGENWWLDSPELSLAAAEEQRERFDEDPWEPQIATWIEDRESVTIDQILHDCIMKPLKDCTQADKNRVGRVLRALNWVRKRVQIGRGKRSLIFCPA